MIQLEPQLLQSAAECEDNTVVCWVQLTVATTEEVTECERSTRLRRGEEEEGGCVRGLRQHTDRPRSNPNANATPVWTNASGSD